MKVILKTQVGIFIDKYVLRNKVQNPDLKAMVKTFNELFFSKMLCIFSVICISHRDKFFDLVRVSDEKKEIAIALWDQLSREFVYYKTHGVMNVDLHRDFIKKLLAHPLIADELNFFLAYHFNNADTIIEILNKGEPTDFQHTAVALLPQSMRNQFATYEKSHTIIRRSVVPVNLTESGIHNRSKFGSDSMNQGLHFVTKGSTKTLNVNLTQEHEHDKKLLMTDVRQTIPTLGMISQAQPCSRDDSDLISFITDAGITDNKRKVQFVKNKDIPIISDKGISKIPKSLIEEITSKGFYDYSDNGTNHYNNSEIRDILF